MNYKLITPVLLSSIASILPIFLILKYSQTTNYIYLFIALCCYIILLFSYLRIFLIKHVTSYTLATQVLYIHLLQILFVILGELVIFKHQINSTRMTGLILGVFSIYFLIK